MAWLFCVAKQCWFALCVRTWVVAVLKDLVVVSALSANYVCVSILSKVFTNIRFSWCENDTHAFQWFGFPGNPLQSTINTRSLMLSLHLTPSASFLLQASSFSCTNLWIFKMYTSNSLFIKKDFFYAALHLTPHFIYPTSPDRQPTWVQIKIFNSWKMSIEMNVLVVGLDSHCSRYIISMFRWKPREQHLLYLFIVLPGMVQTKKQQQQLFLPSTEFSVNLLKCQKKSADNIHIGKLLQQQIINNNFVCKNGLRQFFVGSALIDQSNGVIDEIFTPLTFFFVKKYKLEKKKCNQSGKMQIFIKNSHQSVDFFSSSPKHSNYVSYYQ